MVSEGSPTWPQARWIGMLDIDDWAADTASTVEFGVRRAEGYAMARLLLRYRLRPIEFVEVPIVGGRVRVPVPAVSDPVTESDARPVLPPVSVVICTRDRPDQLAGALESVLALEYPDYEVVVVDNAPRTGATAEVIERLGNERVCRVLEPTPGLSVARNTGLRTARHELVAFTDDDVVVDAHWLRGIAGGFAGSARVACVTGLVPSGELRTPAQAYFERRVSWGDNLRAHTVSMSEPPPDSPLFPFQVGRLGTGANFAVKRSRVDALGGFDEALGAGTAAQGGEDLDIFFRILTSGDAIAVEPSAVVWHRHRSDNAALLSQARGYGVGLGAWLTKVGLDRDHRRLATSVFFRKLGSSLRSGAEYSAIAIQPLDDLGENLPASLGRTEVLAVFGGPRALWRGRRRGARSGIGRGARTR